jgi:hypothetical protein
MAGDEAGNQAKHLRLDVERFAASAQLEALQVEDKIEEFVPQFRSAPGYRDMTSSSSGAGIKPPSSAYIEYARDGGKSTPAALSLVLLVDG